MGRIKEMFFDTPSGNITVNFIEEHHVIEHHEPSKETTYITKKIICLDIDDVRDLFEKTKEFLDWYDKGNKREENVKELVKLLNEEPIRRKKKRWCPFKRIIKLIKELKSLAKIGEEDD